MNVFAVAMVAVLVTMLLALVRAFLGPTVFDRVLAANMFGTKTVLLIAVSGFLAGRPEWLDLALLYALMNFIGMIALLRFSKFANLARRRAGQVMEGLREIAVWFCLLGIGSVLPASIGGLGVLRMPDFYTRSHAAGITDTLGASPDPARARDPRSGIESGHGQARLRVRLPAT